MIGILYISTGRYVVFWKDFFLSVEKNFLTNREKKYFVFTDSSQIYAEENPKVQKIYQENLGWPGNTLLRFEMFEKVRKQLTTCTYLFFLNANTKVVDVVGDEILPDESNDGLVVVLHPGFWDKSVEAFTYDQNPKSTAYIPPGKGKHYFMGGFNGGMTDAYLKMITTLRKNIQLDIDKDVIALWHDESHLNHYILDKHPKILSPEYGYPEGWKLPFQKKLVIIDKTQYGGHHFLRETNKAEDKPRYFSFWKNLFNIFFFVADIYIK